MNSNAKRIIEISWKQEKNIFSTDFNLVQQTLEEMDLNFKVIKGSLFDPDNFIKPQVSSLRELLGEFDALNEDVVLIKDFHHLPLNITTQIVMSCDPHFRGTHKPIFTLTSEDWRYLGRPNRALLDRFAVIPDSRPNFNPYADPSEEVLN